MHRMPASRSVALELFFSFWRRLRLAPFFLLAVAAMQHSQGAFVLTQYGWFCLSQRSDAKSPGASAPGLLFMRGGHATVIWSSLLLNGTGSHERRFWGDQGASPAAVRNPGPESYEAPDDFPVPGLLHVQPWRGSHKQAEGITLK